MNNKLNDKKPLIMTKMQLEYTLKPYCFGKQTLLDFINDIWHDAIPLPDSREKRIIRPTQFKSFVELALKENG